MQTISKLARVFIDFLNVSVLSVILSFIMPYHCIDCICIHADVFGDLKIHIFLRRSLAHISYIYMIFFLSVHLGVFPPPPPPPNSKKHGDESHPLTSGE